MNDHFINLWSKNTPEYNCNHNIEPHAYLTTQHSRCLAPSCKMCQYTKKNAQRGHNEAPFTFKIDGALPISIGIETRDKTTRGEDHDSINEEASAAAALAARLVEMGCSLVDVS